ncbi:MAG: hypothetical protein LBP59_08765 [Planctomycetaceae bacterium]|nr:hypothetical protein [Planctomycetaceae bacterium]
MVKLPKSSGGVGGAYVATQFGNIESNSNFACDRQSRQTQIQLLIVQIIPYAFDNFRRKKKNA